MKINALIARLVFVMICFLMFTAPAFGQLTATLARARFAITEQTAGVGGNLIITVGENVSINANDLKGAYAGLGYHVVKGEIIVPDGYIYIMDFGYRDINLSGTQDGGLLIQWGEKEIKIKKEDIEKYITLDLFQIIQNSKSKVTYRSILYKNADDEYVGAILTLKELLNRIPATVKINRDLTELKNNSELLAKVICIEPIQGNNAFPCLSALNIKEIQNMLVKDKPKPKPKAKRKK